AEHEKSGTYHHCAGRKDRRTYVSDALSYRNQDGEYASDLVNSFSSRFTLLLHFLKVGYSDSQQLQHNGCRDIRHDAQSEDRGIAESSSQTGVNQTEDPFGSTTQLGWVHAWKHDE